MAEAGGAGRGANQPQPQLPTQLEQPRWQEREQLLAQTPERAQQHQQLQQAVRMSMPRTVTTATLREATVVIP